MDNESDFLGQGWSFPVTVSAGKVVVAAGDEAIRQAILIILQTAPGERVMLPAFGCRINELLFAANNAATFSLAEKYVRQALDHWERRIKVTGVKATVVADTPNRLDIAVDYIVRDKNQPGNLVYPFYLK